MPKRVRVARKLLLYVTIFTLVVLWDLIDFTYVLPCPSDLCGSDFVVEAH